MSHLSVKRSSRCHVSLSKTMHVYEKERIEVLKMAGFGDMMLTQEVFNLFSENLLNRPAITRSSVKLKQILGNTTTLEIWSK